MTPVAHWSEDAYYRARESARRAWQARDQQLALGLDREDVTRADDPGCGVLPVEPALPQIPPGAGSPSTHTNGGAAHVPQDERGIPEEGA